MKNSNLLIGLLLLVFIIGKADSCAGTSTVVGDITPDCNRLNEGQIKFMNNTNEKRSFYLNNALVVSVNAHSTSTAITRKVGNYSIKVLNAYNSQDMSCQNTIYISQCKAITYACPF